MKFEKFEKVDPTLPPVPAGAVKQFKVDVFQHVTQVSKDLAPTEVWSFAVNGKYYRGTGVSTPMVVNEGDTVDFTLVNGTDAGIGFLVLTVQVLRPAAAAETAPRTAAVPSTS